MTDIPPPDVPPLEDRPSALIETFKDGSFQESEAGFEALLLPARDKWGEIIDVVAWRLGTERPWWRLRKVADVLGLNAIRKARWDDSDLIVVETPKQWLKLCDPRAVCVLDWSANLEELFGGLQGLVVCKTDALERQFRAVLQRQAGPGLAKQLRVA